jgi:hypothetical protein
MNVEFSNSGVNLGKDGVENLLHNKKVVVYFVLIKEQGWEISSLENVYQQFRTKMNDFYHSDLFPARATSRIEATDPSTLSKIELSLPKVLDKDDDNIYFFFFQSELIQDYGFLHPEHPKVKVMPVSKLEELYALGKEAIEDISHNAAS